MYCFKILFFFKRDFCFSSPTFDRMQAHIQASPLDVVSTEFAESKNEKNEKRVARKCLALCFVVSLKSVSVSGGCFNILA